MAAPSSPAQGQLVLTGPTPPSSTTSRRLPPPCWSHEETVALIDAYCGKWYSLRRGNLRASHWQEVADDVAARFPLSSGNPPKTCVQCRHKMEKLRKRYRAELQRAFATPNGHRYCSSWVHFKRMDSMEKGSSPAVPVNSGPIEDEEEEDDEDQDDPEDLYPRNVKHAPRTRSVYGSRSNGIGCGSGFRIRIPGRSTMAPAGAKVYSKFDEISYPSPNPNYGSTKVLRDDYLGMFGLGKSGGGGGGVGKKRERDAMAEIVSAIKVLGDGFVRMERMKMEMAREVEAMRMDMEMKRTEMILESQQRIVEAFAKAFSEKKTKKVKRMPTPES